MQSARQTGKASDCTCAALPGTSSVRAEPSPPGSCNKVLSDCAGDIAKALSTLGVRNPSDLGKVPQDKLSAFTSDPKNKPSGACCKAACEGNRQVGAGCWVLG
jgi:hypothetical protein